jgi:hypothetical protein
MSASKSFDKLNELLLKITIDCFRWCHEDIADYVKDPVPFGEDERKVRKLAGLGATSYKILVKGINPFTGTGFHNDELLYCNNLRYEDLYSNKESFRSLSRAAVIKGNSRGNKLIFELAEFIKGNSTLEEADNGLSRRGISVRNISLDKDILKKIATALRAISIDEEGNKITAEFIYHGGGKYEFTNPLSDGSEATSLKNKGFRKEMKGLISSMACNLEEIVEEINEGKRGNYKFQITKSSDIMASKGFKR